MYEREREREREREILSFYSNDLLLLNSCLDDKGISKTYERERLFFFTFPYIDVLKFKTKRKFKQ